MRLCTRTITATLIVICARLSNMDAQNLSVGVVGGGSLTNSFPTETFPTGSAGLRFYSSSKDYLVGPMLEYHFTPNWSVEVDGLFRTLHMTFAGVESNGSLNSISPSPVVTWEFPLLAKYRLPLWRALPLVELGPSFRTAGNLNGSNPSHFGVAAGIGVEFHARNLTVAPGIRYTRWAQDTVGPDHPTSSPNQVELLAEFSATAASDVLPLGPHFFAGVLVGTGLTDDIRTQSFSESTGVPNISEVTTPARGIIAGALVGMSLPRHFSVEINGLYHPLRSETLTTYNGMKGTPSLGSTATWELPVLAKYKFPDHFLKPFAEAGPSFRLPPGGQFSNHGVTMGAGVEVQASLLKIAPEIRFTHWAPDPPPGNSGTIPNQAELLIAFYF
jgi:hypothetical protein